MRRLSSPRLLILVVPPPPFRPAQCCVLFFAGAAADVHWLNSLEDGNACLLVDCYRDLADSVALEEAFLLIEVGTSLKF